MRRERAPERLHGDGGAALVEAALVLPVLLWLVLALFDFSLLELRQSQASSASRDGARAGIVSWFNAQAGSYSGGTCPATPDSFNKICLEVQKRLAGSNVGTITARCYDASTGAQVTCALDDGHRGTDYVTPGIDMIEVRVTSTYRPITNVGQVLLGTSRSYSSSTRMVIQ